MLADANVARLELPEKNVDGAFLEINAPPAVFKAGDVMADVVTNDGSRLQAERIDSAHVGKDRAIAVGKPADVVKVVEFDDIAPGQRQAVAPAPSIRYG